ncbi:MAG: AMP-binding protein [Hyphomicrobiales bacterium]|nr:AMP-binding protein [Hyphomicrobiales bacterium]
MRQRANLTAFMAANGVADYADLTARADADPDWFWDRVIAFYDYRFYRPYDRVCDDSAGKPWIRWCLGGTTNVVLNALDRRRGTDGYGRLALSWEGEDGTRLSWTYADVDRETCRAAAGLRRLSLGPGDVIAMHLPNVPEAMVTLLAIAKVGGIALPLFSGFGAEAVATRLQIAGAKAVVTVDGSPRRGRVVAAKPVVDEAARQVDTLRHVIVVHRAEVDIAWTEGRDVWWHDLAPDHDGDEPTAEVPADSPFLLMFTSGTTGKPKGVVHTHVGFPVKGCLDMGLCMDFKASDRIMWMSDMGWAVGPLLVYGSLVMGGTVVLVEGAPNYPEPDRMWRLVADHRVSFLGVAPTIVRTLMPNGPEQLAGHDLSCLRVFTSTGEPWTPDAWMWLFEHVGRGRVPLINFSGGTEMIGILSSTVLHPMKPCSFTGPIPGTGADIVDADGNSLPPGQVGELVMRQAPLGLTQGLWHDNERYMETYWNVVPGMWVHGDFASRDEDGLWYIHGRSDDTLKIAGKRTGPAEIESLLLATGELVEAAVIGLPDPVKGQALVCVCVPRGAADEALAQRLGEAVVAGLGVPYRPQRIVFVADLPKTRNMKIMRRVVRAVFGGDDPGDLSSLVNPEAVTDLAARFKG